MPRWTFGGGLASKGLVSQGIREPLGELLIIGLVVRCRFEIKLVTLLVKNVKLIQSRETL